MKTEDANVNDDRWIRGRSGDGMGVRMTRRRRRTERTRGIRPTWCVGSRRKFQNLVLGNAQTFIQISPNRQAGSHTPFSPPPQPFGPCGTAVVPAGRLVKVVHRCYVSAVCLAGMLAARQPRLSITHSPPTRLPKPAKDKAQTSNRVTEYTGEGFTP